MSVNNLGFSSVWVCVCVHGSLPAVPHSLYTIPFHPIPNNLWLCSFARSFVMSTVNVIKVVERERETLASHNNTHNDRMIGITTKISNQLKIWWIHSQFWCFEMTPAIFGKQCSAVNHITLAMYIYDDASKKLMQNSTNLEISFHSILFLTFIPSHTQIALDLKTYLTCVNKQMVINYWITLIIWKLNVNNCIWNYVTWIFVATKRDDYEAGKTSFTAAFVFYCVFVIAFCNAYPMIMMSVRC